MQNEVLHCSAEITKKLMGKDFALDGSIGFSKIVTHASASM